MFFNLIHISTIIRTITAKISSFIYLFFLNEALTIDDVDLKTLLLGHSKM